MYTIQNQYLFEFKNANLEIFNVSTFDYSFATSNKQKMKKYTLTILLFLTLGFMSADVYGQTNEPKCVHDIRHKVNSAFLEYLFKKYGIESAEQILLKLKTYEVNNNVFVLFSKDYFLLMERINGLLLLTQNDEEILRLNERKTKFVKFEDIEALLN